MRSQIPRSGGFSGPSTATAPSGESGEHAPWWIARQSARGRASGQNRRAAVRERDLRIVVALDAGLSQREVAAVVGVSPMTVKYGAGSSLGGGVQRTNTGRGFLGSWAVGKRARTIP